LEQEELDAFLEENLRTGRIRPSKSPIAVPVFFIKKKDGSLQLVQNYRVLNAVTVKNRYPLPLISELVSQLCGAKYFTKLDVWWGFNNVHIKPRNEWKVAFHTNRGLFEPLVMFFGMTNSPATFQTIMNDIFRTLIAKGIVVVYLDNILIFTRTEEEHEQVVRRVLEVLAEHKLFLRPEKCEFHQKEIEYLGLVISENKVAMDPVKVARVCNWPTLENQSLPRRIGHLDYAPFIETLASMTGPFCSGKTDQTHGLLLKTTTPDKVTPSSVQHSKAHSSSGRPDYRPENRGPPAAHSHRQRTRVGSRRDTRQSLAPEKIPVSYQVEGIWP